MKTHDYITFRCIWSFRFRGSRSEGVAGKKFIAQELCIQSGISVEYEYLAENFPQNSTQNLQIERIQAVWFPFQSS